MSSGVLLEIEGVYTINMDDSESSFEWEDILDLTSFSEEDLRLHLEAYSIEEREISYRRRVLQGRVDLLRAELIHRGGLSVSPDDLARALLGDSYSGVSSDYPSGVSTPERFEEENGSSEELG